MTNFFLLSFFLFTPFDRLILVHYCFSSLLEFVFYSSGERRFFFFSLSSFSFLNPPSRLMALHNYHVCTRRLIDRPFMDIPEMKRHSTDAKRRQGRGGSLRVRDTMEHHKGIHRNFIWDLAFWEMILEGKAGFVLFSTFSPRKRSKPTARHHGLVRRSMMMVKTGFSGRYLWSF